MDPEPGTPVSTYREWPGPPDGGHAVLCLWEQRVGPGRGPCMDPAALAGMAGYADQAHLSRDVRELAAARPAELLREPLGRAGAEAALPTAEQAA